MGCILYEMAAGQKPFDSDWEVIQRQPLSVPISLPVDFINASEYNQKMRHILSQALQWDPTLRPAARYLHQEFLEFLNSRPFLHSNGEAKAFAEKCQMYIKTSSRLTPAILREGRV